MEAKLPIYGLAGLSNEQINAELHRKIRSGKQYDHYMPFSDCSSVKLAEGDTKVAIDNMVMWSNKYTHHTKDLSVLFASDDLQKTCEAIHTFLYHHFQYKIDGFKQNLRSPACSWASRKNGIDCKSYSIFASTILTNLGIKHYFRRIKQQPNEGFTHVYVVVPKNQNTSDLANGYYCIDGTLSFKNEPLFFKNDDVFVGSGLNGLGSVLAMVGNEVLKMAIQQVVMPLVAKGLNDLRDELLGVYDCQNMGLGIKEMSYKVDKELRLALTVKLKKIGEAIAYNDITGIENTFNDLFYEFDLGYAHLQHFWAYGARGCEETVSVVLKYIEKLKEIVDGVYKNFKQEFTYLKITETQHEAMTGN